MRNYLVLLLLALAGCGGGGGASAPPIAPLPKPATLPRYELIQNNGPVVVLMATNIEDTLGTGLLPRTVPDLIAAGFSVLVLDLPCHGADAEPGVDPLRCWRRRLEAGDADLFRKYCGGLVAVMDALGIDTANAVGLSRGGYVAATCAYFEPRLTALVLVEPVTDLQKLTEFDGYTADTRLRLLNYRAELARHDILVRIGKADDRVDTASAVEFANAVHADLTLLDTVGHVAPDDGSVTAWLLVHQ